MVQFYESSSSEEEDTDETDSDSSSPKKSSFENLLDAMRSQHWQKVLTLLPQISPEVLRSPIGPAFQFSEDSILHSVVIHVDVPVEVVETMLRCAKLPDAVGSKSSLAAMRNEVGETPLHTAIQFLPERLDIVNLLLQAYPNAVHQRDHDNMRPIDHLSNKIIMLQEFQKYHILDEKDKTVWKTLQAVILASNPNGSDSGFSEGQTHERYLVHTCLQTKGIPVSITEFVMEHHSEEIQLPDTNGDLPLHIVARRTISRKIRTDENDSADEESETEEFDYLERVLNRYPAAASRMNKRRQIPLTVAIESGRTLNSGALCLLDAYPEGIIDLGITVELLPALLARLGTHGSTAFDILRAQPDLFEHIKRK